MQQLAQMLQGANAPAQQTQQLMQFLGNPQVNQHPAIMQLISAALMQGANPLAIMIGVTQGLTNLAQFQQTGGMNKSQSLSSLQTPTSGAQRGPRFVRKIQDPHAEEERRKQQEKMFSLDLDKIRQREDRRTTLMIRNIPNKYTQKMLLASVDELFKGKYNFFYLPIDFKNKCNVGYAFINMIDPVTIVPLVERFDKKKWDKFNSEKVASITYARIQGKAALVSHFQNSSLMLEDKKCRPMIFADDGTPEVFPVGPNARPRSMARSGSRDALNQDPSSMDHA